MSRRGAMWPTWLFSDKSFLELSHLQQLLFMKLWLSPNLDPAGFHALQISKWARSTGPSLPERDVRDTILGLEEAGWLVVDYDLEELLVRPFIRWDAATKPQIYIAAMRAIQAAQSMELRRAAWAEVIITYPPKCEGLKPQLTRAYEELARFIDERGEGFWNPPGTLPEPCDEGDVDDEGEPGGEERSRNRNS